MKLIKLTKTEKRHALTGYAFVLPWIVGFAAFFAFPLFRSLQLSFVDVLNMSDYQVKWAGLAHYKEVLQTDTWYIKHFGTTVKEMVTHIPMINIFSIFIAILLNRNFKGRAIYRTLFFLPVILGSGFIMSQLSGQGVQNEAMETAQTVLLPMQIRIYLGSKGTKIIMDFLTLITEVLWKCGVQIIIYLSALQSIPTTLYEAARVDSATDWEMFWLITLPMITPMILLNLVYSIVDTFINADNALFKHIETTAFGMNEFENSSAMSWMFFVWAMILVAIVFLIMRPFINKVKE